MVSALETYDVLSNLVENSPVTPSSETISYMQERGLIRTIDSESYSILSSTAGEFESKLRGVRRAKSRVKLYDSRLKNLSKKSNSFFHKFFHRQSTLDSEKDEVLILQERLSDEREKLKSNESELDKIRRAREDLEGYTSISGMGVKLTEKGREAQKRLAVRKSRIGDLSYDQFEEEVDSVYSAINDRYSRAIDIYHRIISSGQYPEGWDTQKFSVSISGLEGSIDEIVEKAKDADRLFCNRGWNLTSGLLASARVLTLPDLKKAVSQLESTFDFLVEQDNSHSYQTLTEAAVVMAIPGNSIEDQFYRYWQMSLALNKRDWKKGSHYSCMMAAELSRKDGDHQEIADCFRNQEIKIAESGVKDCHESGLAALILMDAPGTPDEKAKRFKATLDLVNGIGEEKVDNYSPAAIISLMPGNIEENISLLNYTLEKFSEDDFCEPISNAASIISRNYLHTSFLGSTSQVGPSSSEEPEDLIEEESEDEDEDDFEIELI